jgi:hypothetical protein
MFYSCIEKRTLHAMSFPDPDSIFYNSIFNFLERDVYIYPSFLISPDKIAGHPWGMVTLAPIEGLCKTKSTEDCIGTCTRCQNSCVYTMELNRPRSACNAEGTFQTFSNF